jgi:hypothetical protein
MQEQVAVTNHNSEKQAPKVSLHARLFCDARAGHHST